MVPRRHPMVRRILLTGTSVLTCTLGGTSADKMCLPTRRDTRRCRLPKEDPRRRCSEAGSRRQGRDGRRLQGRCWRSSRRARVGSRSGWRRGPSNAGIEAATPEIDWRQRGQGQEAEQETVKGQDHTPRREAGRLLLRQAQGLAAVACHHRGRGHAAGDHNTVTAGDSRKRAGRLSAGLCGRWQEGGRSDLSCYVHGDKRVVSLLALALPCSLPFEWHGPETDSGYQRAAAGCPIPTSSTSTWRRSGP
jgi:hypothetical protein